MWDKGFSGQNSLSVNDSSLCCGADHSQFDSHRCAKCHEGASFDTHCDACLQRCLVDGQPI